MKNTIHVPNPNPPNVDGSKGWSHKEFVNGMPILVHEAFLKEMTEWEQRLYEPAGAPACWRIRPERGPAPKSPIRRMQEIRAAVAEQEKYDAGKVEPAVNTRDENFLLSLSPLERMNQLRRNALEDEEAAAEKDLQERIRDGRAMDNPRRLSKKARQRELRKKRLEGQNC